MTIAKIHIFITWFVLILLTLVSFFADVLIKNYVFFVLLAMVVVFIKGQLIVDVFMELKTAPKKWRLILLSYVMIVPIIISLIYML